MPKTVFDRRIALLKDELCARKLDALLVTKDVNVSYLSGFTGHDAAIIVTKDRPFFIADSRYIEDAEESMKGFGVRLVRKSLYENIKEIVREEKVRRLGFESADIPYEVHVRLKETIGSNVVVPAGGPVERLRQVKDREEIALIRGSIGLAKKVFADIRPTIRPGASEEAVARNISVAFLRNGAKAGFDPIVAADANSSRPHAVPTDRKMARNSFVMVDMGCSLKQYNSDITRMVMLGKASPKIKKIYSVVKAAQECAIDAIRPGVKAAVVDAAARKYIQDEGFGRYFGHALGHGVGLEVHEQPMISCLSEAVLRAGMVFTVEPAIYIPKLGGMRIEDMVLVTETGVKIL